MPQFLHVATGLIDFIIIGPLQKTIPTYLGIVYVFLLFPFVLQIIVTKVVPPSLAKFLP